ncbi:hypothetical protein PVAND_005165 [Polypedilum vanderplanki]|uniref:Chitin-binding type-2 domain-containing protein n=1 Tax=Polypedilum vanderplanki TaxID=319348 RepID=A0A9J6BZS5_POLVA|nr:hypothetical protein PVAND_005165 [Polypedilum vanderplanki]
MKFILLILFAILSASFAAFDGATWCAGKANKNYPYGTDCTQYVKCYPYNGVMTGALYTCVGTTLFNATALLCQAGYVCPAATTSSTITTTSSTSTMTSTTTTPTTTTSTTLPTTTTTMSTTTTTTASSTFNAATYCASQPFGYQPYVPDLTNCIKYIYCFPYNGVMTGAVYECQGTTRFDPMLLYCSSTYSC